MKSLSALLLAAAVACAGSDDVVEPCPLPASTDDLVRISAPPLDPFPAIANASARVGSRVLVCGDGYVAAVTPDGTQPDVLPSADLAGTCAGISQAGSDRAVVVTSAGRIILLDVPGSGTPSVIASSLRASTTFRDVWSDGVRVWAAAGVDGVVGYSIAANALAEDALVASSDAHSVTPFAGALLVADGSVPSSAGDDGGAETRLLSTSDGSQLAEIVGLPGIASKVIADGSRAIVLRPGYGFDVLDVDLAAASPVALRYSRAVATGLPLDAALLGDSLFVAAGSQLQRYVLGDSDATLVSTEDRAAAGDLLGPWFRSVAIVGDVVVAVTDESIVPIAVGDGSPSPEISLEQTTFSLASDQVEALLKFENTGEVELVVAGVEADAPFSAEPYDELSTPRPDCPGQYLVAPGEGMLAWQRYSGEAGHQSAALRFLSNDADEPELVATSEINRPVPQVGDPVDDFSLPTVDGSHFRASEHIGVVVVAKLYNPL